MAVKGVFGLNIKKGDIPHSHYNIQGRLQYY